MTSVANPDLNRLGDLMNTAGFQAAWVANADLAMKNNGVNAAAIPPGILAALKAFTTKSELDYMARVGQGFRDAGAEPESGLRMV